MCSLDPGPFLEKLASVADVEAFSRILMSTGSVIAGGSVLQPYAGFEAYSQDFDIYVPVRRLSDFLEDLKNLDAGTDIYHTHMSSEYDRGFMKKNGIVCRTEISFGGSRLDVMGTSKEPTKVVNNFDLECCEIWFDGENVLTNHANDIGSKITRLKPKYVRSYIEGNGFTRGRMEKYHCRGFTISFDVPEFTVTEYSPDARGMAAANESDWLYSRIFDRLMEADSSWIARYPPIDGPSREYTLTICSDPDVRERYTAHSNERANYFPVDGTGESVLVSDDPSLEFMANVIIHIATLFTRMNDYHIGIMRENTRDIIDPSFFDGLSRRIQTDSDDDDDE